MADFDEQELKSELISLFGVTFRKDQIPISSDGKPMYHPEHVVLPNGEVSLQALVELNNGTTIRFPKQDSNAKSSVIINKYNNEVRFSNIEGLTVWDTSNDDKYYLSNCTGTLDAKREKTFSWNSTNGMGISYGKITKITSKDKDKIRIGANSKIQVNYTKGYDNLTLY